MAVPRVFHPVPSTSECQVRYQHGTNLLENGFAYGFTGANPSTAELLALATAIAGSIADKMRDVMHNGVVMREVYCRNINTEVANQATYTFPAGTNARRTGSPVASNEAARIVKRTGQTGRSHRGANSFSEFVEGDVDGNSIGSSLFSGLLSLGLEIILNRVGSRFTAGVASRRLFSAFPISSATLLDNNIDSQKTRLNAHGD